MKAARHMGPSWAGTGRTPTMTAHRAIHVPECPRNIPLLPQGDRARPACGHSPSRVEKSPLVWPGLGRQAELLYPIP
jgi:hypothetical protein